jgi:hypothetical protein
VVHAATIRIAIDLRIVVFWLDFLFIFHNPAFFQLAVGTKDFRHGQCVLYEMALKSWM